jgi:nitrate reductase cytochrome c-type subunit
MPRYHGSASSLSTFTYKGNLMAKSMDKQKKDVKKKPEKTLKEKRAEKAAKKK